MDRRLVVTEDLPAAAAELWTDVQPRTVVLAGGSTPRAVYERLATLDYSWDEVDVLFGDERCVPPGHPDSNLSMAEATLLSRVPARVHPMPGVSCHAAAYEEVVRRVLGEPPRVDLAFLGLGADGHTASLFPGDSAVEERDRLVVRVERPDHPRLTLTLPVLSAAATAVFLVAGEEKRVALHRLMDGDDIPAARITAGQVVILADPLASG